MRLHSLFLIALVLLTIVSRSFAAPSVVVRLERAPSANGPWTPIDLEKAGLDGDGNPRLPMNSTNEFFRTRVELSPEAAFGDPIPLAEIPSDIRNRAETLLSKRIGLSDDPEGWPDGSKLAPFARAMHSSADGGLKPAFFEFKVLRPTAAKPTNGPLATLPEEYLQLDSGYLLLGATTEDFPIAEFSTEGPTLTETLAKAANTSRIRVVRYGPGLAFAEDEKGNPLASLGSVPFRLDAGIFELNNLEWNGDDTNRVDQSPGKIPELKISGYNNYAEFKNDFETNQIYREMRKIRAARAKIEWDVANGNPPSGTNLTLGETIRVFSDLPLLPLPEVSLVSESDELLRISVSSTGGIRVTATSTGTGMLRARVGDTERTMLVRVTRGLAATAVISSGTSYALGWGEQPKYHQFENSDWCPVVGCGPVAWAMLFAWFERNWGVEYAFRGEGNGNLPPTDTIGSSNRGRAYAAYNELHELCDVICAGGSGATYPTDMTEGFKGYTYLSALSDQIRRKWTINSVTGTWPEAGALRCRDAIKDGYPAVVGLGYFWHYALAYGYHYDEIQAGNHTFVARYLKCNMGWGPNVSPRWYNMLDTFYAADVKIWRGPNG